MTIPITPESVVLISGAAGSGRTSALAEIAHEKVFENPAHVVAVVSLEDDLHGFPTNAVRTNGYKHLGTHDFDLAHLGRAPDFLLIDSAHLLYHLEFNALEHLTHIVRRWRTSKTTLVMTVAASRYQAPDIIMEPLTTGPQPTAFERLLLEDPLDCLPEPDPVFLFDEHWTMEMMTAKCLRGPHKGQTRTVSMRRVGD